MISDSSDVDAVAAKFTEAVNLVSKAMKFLIANGIEPTHGQGDIAFQWARGEMEDDEFLILARLIATEEQ